MLQQNFYAKKRAKKKGIEWSQEDDVLEIPSKKNVQARRGKVYTDIKNLV